MTGADEFVLLVLPTNGAAEVGADGGEDAELAIFRGQHVDGGLVRLGLPCVPMFDGDCLRDWGGDGGEVAYGAHVGPVALDGDSAQRKSGEAHKGDGENQADSGTPDGKK